ncbi:hypothetical protein [Okeania sp.]|uniref:hypothetical protein n=1 Tax=Okeania sp. TaxID=3100323 RepID=UPI002B4B2714|nr:hypothetical protein [Okeania sp.]
MTKDRSYVVTIQWVFREGIVVKLEVGNTEVDFLYGLKIEAIDFISESKVTDFLLLCVWENSSNLLLYINSRNLGLIFASNQFHKILSI